MGGFKGRFHGFVDEDHTASLAFCGIRYYGHAATPNLFECQYSAHFKENGSTFIVSARTPLELKNMLSRTLKEVRELGEVVSHSDTKIAYPTTNTVIVRPYLLGRL